MRLPPYFKTLADIAIIVLLVLNATPAFKLSFVEALERVASDIRLRSTMPGTIDDRIVIADIDEESLSAIGQWPWHRDRIGELTDTLFDHYQVNTVGFDMVFAEADDSAGLRVLQSLDDSPVGDLDVYRQTAQALKPRFDFDQQFSRSLRDRNVVLGFVFDENQTQTINVLPEPIAQLDSSLSNQLQLFKPRGFTANLEILQSNAASAGFFDNPDLDQDGQYRRAPLLQIYGDGIYPSLALAVVRTALGNAGININVQDNRQGYTAIEQVQVGSLLIPVDQHGSVVVPYRGRQGSFPYFSIIDLLNKTVPVEALQDSIVLVGTTAPGLLDLRATPVASAFAGVEVHANIISGILDQRIPLRPAWVVALEMTLLVLLGAAVMVIPRWLSPAQIILFLVGLTALVIYGSFAAWNNGLILPLASPVLLILSIYLIHMSWGFLVENSAKRAITRLFGSYVPPELVDEMAENPGDVGFEGQAREMTVLFSDVRGFTSISEGVEPKELCKLMNELLTPMTRVIHGNRGTIDKYMGDCIMAFWGAPMRHESHAHAGVETALAMISGLDEMNANFANHGWPAIRLGVGLNTGRMNVGNMGSEFRMAYTVMGDAVNLGSRLEGLTKNYGVDIIVSDSTRAAAPDFAYVQLDRVRVKGRDEPVEIFEPLGLKTELRHQQEAFVREFHEALENYWALQWNDAEAALDSIASTAGTCPETGRYLPLVRMYLQRIARYRSEPPQPDWDGVFTHTSK